MLRDVIFHPRQKIVNCRKDDPYSESQHTLNEIAFSRMQAHSCKRFWIPLRRFLNCRDREQALPVKTYSSNTS